MTVGVDETKSKNRRLGAFMRLFYPNWTLIWCDELGVADRGRNSK
jgi:hypothetical protein